MILKVGKNGGRGKERKRKEKYLGAPPINPSITFVNLKWFETALHVCTRARVCTCVRMLWV